MAKYKVSDLRIGNEVKVKFDGVYYKSGRNEKGPWSLLSIRFSDDTSSLEDNNWSVESMGFIEREGFNIKLSQLANTLAGEDIWNNPEHNPLERKSYMKAYRNIVKNLNRYKNTELYVKTIIKDRTENDKFISMLPYAELLMLENNIIFSKDAGILKYNVLEINNLEDFGLDPENLPRPPVIDFKSVTPAAIQRPDAGMKPYKYNSPTSREKLPF